MWELSAKAYNRPIVTLRRDSLWIRRGCPFLHGVFPFRSLNLLRGMLGSGLQQDGGCVTWMYMYLQVYILRKILLEIVDMLIG